MKFQTALIPGTLIRRYKRFLADIRLDDGREVTAHCANPGAMLGLNNEGLRVWLEPVDNPARKLKFSWRLAELGDGAMAGIDTSLPNRIVAEALGSGHIKGVSDYTDIKAEVKYGQASRVDFLLSGQNCPDCYLEVKNAHLSRAPGLAEFPDSVTKRGAKHLDELAAMVGLGHRAILLFVVQRNDCHTMTLAHDLDPHYAARFAAAQAAGVEVLVYDCAIDTTQVSLNAKLPFRAPGGDKGR